MDVDNRLTNCLGIRIGGAIVFDGEGVVFDGEGDNVFDGEGDNVVDGEGDTIVDLDGIECISNQLAVPYLLHCSWLDSPGLSSLKLYSSMQILFWQHSIPLSVLFQRLMRKATVSTINLDRSSKIQVTSNVTKMIIIVCLK